ncbi:MULTISPECIES: YhcN/YlaJ family sporulation lipoprotein [Paenibacillus]|uniref:YhcN/YlaJ family sporulation lipoprotein n=1 Tax=Paenibacillus TaxID=44249 RepID=UPI00203C9D36|nr:YhcN/YlaJ family sporulation lipoprotein [Paenibacillus camelliae]MCM3632260.1 YhcN/YlaJ family sporulation lipoprotein [Paenibacillus camelliae]
MKKELVVLTMMITMLVGCNSNATPPSNNNNNDQTMQTQQVKPQSISANQDEAIVHLEKLAKGIEGVEDAHVVIMGNNAIVGINVDPNLERSRVGTIKYSVAEAFRNDPLGINAIVTADIDLQERIAEVGKDMRAGRPFQGIAEELADIVGRIVPQVPADLMPAQKEHQIEATESNGTYQTPEQLVEEHEQNMKGK